MGSKLAILEKEVWVRVHSNTVRYYEELGYAIPLNEKTGRVNTKSKIKVMVEHLLDSSSKKVTKVCDICEKCVPNQRYESIKRSREGTDGLDRCWDCSVPYRAKSRKNNVSYEKSLEHYAKINNKKYLIDEWSERNTKRPSEVSSGTLCKFWWTCETCGSSYDLSPSFRTYHGQNCPFCAGKRVNHTNCIRVTHPDVATLFAEKSLTKQISAGSDKKVDFICLRCNHRVKSKVVNQVVQRGLSCPSCSDGISYPEKFVYNLLESLDISFTYQKRFAWFKNKIYDFYIEEWDCIVEVHGRQHYEDGGWMDLEEVEENDKKKEDRAKEYVSNYIVIDARKSELLHMKESIQNSRLSKFIELNKVDWLQCHEQSCKNSFLVKVNQLWNEGIENVDYIVKKTGLHKQTVAKYLNEGAKLNLSNYNPKNAQVQSGRKRARPVIQLSTQGIYLNQYSSVTQASEFLNKKIKSGISLVCKGKQKTAGGYKWMYKEDYDKMIEEKGDV